MKFTSRSSLLLQCRRELPIGQKLAHAIKTGKLNRTLRGINVHNNVSIHVNVNGQLVSVEGQSTDLVGQACREIQQLQRDLFIVEEEPVREEVSLPPSFLLNRSGDIAELCRSFNVKVADQALLEPNTANVSVYGCCSPMVKITMRGLSRDVKKAKEAVKSMVPDYRIVYIPLECLDRVFLKNEAEVKVMEVKYGVRMTLEWTSAQEPKRFVVCLIEDDTSLKEDDSSSTDDKSPKGCLAAKLEMERIIGEISTDENLVDEEPAQL